VISPSSLFIYHQLSTPPLLYLLSMYSPIFTLSFPHLYCIFTTTFLFLLTDPCLKWRTPSKTSKKYPNMSRYHLKRSRFFIKSGLSRDMHEIIEAKACLASELPSLFIKHLLDMGKSSYAKKCRVKRMKVCYKCAR